MIANKDDMDSRELRDRLESSLEFKAKADLQRSAFYERLVVIGAGSLAGGATVAASIAVKLGKLVGRTHLIASLVLLGVLTCVSMLNHGQLSAMSFFYTRCLAALRSDHGNIEHDIEQLIADDSKKKIRLGKFWTTQTERLGKSSNSLRGARRSTIFDVGFSGLFAVAFSLYVLFIIENVMLLPH